MGFCPGFLNQATSREHSNSAAYCDGETNKFLLKEA